MVLAEKLLSKPHRSLGLSLLLVMYYTAHCWAGRGGVHCVVILLSNNQSIAMAPYPWLLALLSVDGMKIMQLAANTLNVC